MSDAASEWHPRYEITPSIARRLMEIEAARVVVEKTPLPPAVQAELAHRARVRATHFSTRIEGNRLTLEEAEEVISHRRTHFAGRERDVAEVQNYWNALVRMEDWAAGGRPVTEDLIRRIHAIVMKGSRSKPLPYRDGQNVIRDSTTGAIVYLPPEAKDVPSLMKELVNWIGAAEKAAVPGVIIAALAHYQFVTIHPYYDGNGRTARLLASFILQKSGYGLDGLFSLEEYHSRDLDAYYQSLDVGEHHNYYFGRAEADLTGWLAYFAATLESVFLSAKDETLRCANDDTIQQPQQLRELDHRARVVLGLFGHQQTITSQDVALALGLSGRMARVLIAQWVESGWLIVQDPSKRARKYGLSPEFEDLLLR